MAWDTEFFTVYYRGLSRDLRTNQWEVYCKKCGKNHYPPTTMFAHQTVECPKCLTKAVINYNNYP